MESTILVPSPVSPSPSLSKGPCGVVRWEMSPAGGAAPTRCLIGGGLANLGNTCFLNVSVQCLVHTVPLVQALMSSHHSSCCSESDESFCAICAFGNVMEFCLRASGRVVCPRAFVSNLSKISPSFQVYQQEDAHEFLSCLLDCLDSCDRRSPPTQASSFINDIFGGRLRSQVRCCECGHSSDTFEPLLDLSLEIEKADTVMEALHSFTKVERIDGPWTCEGCKAQVSVDKQLSLDKLPAVVILHLKRFKSDGFSYHKLDKHVYCPNELDFGPFLCSNDEEAVESMYDLYAVVVHGGFQMYSGHYYCYIRSSVDVWHEMDDSDVTRVSEEHVGMQEAYILFYKKRGSSPWFADFTKKQVVDLHQHKDISPASVLHSGQSLDYRVEDAELIDTTKQAGCLSSCVSDPSTIRRAEVDDEPMVDVASKCEVMEPSTSYSLEKQVSKAAAYDQLPTPPPRSSIPEERTIDVFYDEHLEEEQEDYHQVLPKFEDKGKPACKPKVECELLHETINRQMRNMPRSRRRTLMAHIPLSHSCYLNHQTRRRRLT